MRSFFLIPMILLLSCGKSNERAFYGQNLNPSFKGQSLTATQIQCESIKTNITDTEITCPMSFINEDKQFLFSIDMDEQAIDMKKYPELGEVELEISIKEMIHARFYLVSKYGKRLSEDTLFDGSRTLKFQELNRGDFAAHEIYLKINNYFTGDRPKVVSPEEDLNCNTGIFNINDVNLADLKGQCENLKFIPLVKAKVIIPKVETVSINGRLSALTTANSPIKLPNRDLVNFKYVSVSDLEEGEVDPSLFYLESIDQYGLHYFLNDSSYCVTVGVMEVFKVNIDKSLHRLNISHYEGLNIIKDKSSYKISRQKKCYPVEPVLTGFVVVKE
ncbi:hypothetical protein [Halobacteriovorax sp. RT-2-4]|uniref:hypothetical protein n=1 Tax=unclassified Halobacteriovorax TaxID=2639665 RepID=UPI00399C3DA6